ncbi:MAG: hypothetical protein OXE40_13625, partial [Gammaproteobacteria bacterium]|nr:hypothetical protein [Gammaproteobacteria bacterium]
MADTRTCFAFHSVCLWALLVPVSAIFTEARAASFDRSQDADLGRFIVKIPERPLGTDDFSDEISSGGDGPEMVVVP